MNSDSQKRKRGAQSISVSHLNIRESIAILVGRLVTLEVIGVFLLGVTGFPVLNSLFPEVQFLHAVRLALFFLIAVTIIWVTISVILQWTCEYYEIYPDYIVHRSGVFHHSFQRHPLQDMATCGVDQGMLGQMLNFGTIHLYDMRNMKHIYIPFVHNPNRYFQIITSLVPFASAERTSFGAPQIAEEDRIP